VEHEIFYEFLLGVCTKLRKATTNFVMSVFRMERLGSHWKMFIKFNIWVPSKNLQDNRCK